MSFREGQLKKTKTKQNEHGTDEESQSKRMRYQFC